MRVRRVARPQPTIQQIAYTSVEAEGSIAQEFVVLDVIALAADAGVAGLVVGAAQPTHSSSGSRGTSSAS
jgi:hypothetical protein